MRAAPITLSTPLSMHGQASREPGAPPFWQAGQEIVWQTTTGFASPMRVVRDDARGLVAWLAPGSERASQVLADGGPVRRDGVEDHVSDRFPHVGTWQGPGILRISPTGLPWSIWLFRDEAGEFAIWYINLESPHRRGDRVTWSEDQILDLEISPDGRVLVKDADDLDSAVACGRVSASDAETIRANGIRALAWAQDRPWPFDEEWTNYQPPSHWGPLALPADQR